MDPNLVARIRMDSFDSFNGADNITGNTIGNNFYGNMSMYENTNQFTTCTFNQDILIFTIIIQLQ